MTADEPLLTPADLGKVLRIPEAQVLDLRRKHDWPHVRLSRKSIRFTAEQVEQIVAQHSAAAPSKTPARVPAIPGQTKGSRARRSA